MSFYLIPAALTLALQTPGAGAGPPEGVEVQVEVLPDSITIGDHFTLKVSVQGAAPGRVVFPSLPDTGAVAALGPPRIIEGPGERVQSAFYEMAAWRVGELELPPIELSVEREGEAFKVPWPEVRIQVASVLPADADPDTLAWRPPWGVVGPNWSLAEILMVAGLALALLLATLLYLRRRRSVGQPFPGLPGKSPRERALEALEHLQASGLLEVSELKAFYSELSRIIREFLAESQPNWGWDLTTRELLIAVGSDGVTESDLQTMADLLVEADLVKFARRRPSAERPPHALSTTRAWVEGFTRQTEEEPDSEETANAEGEAGTTEQPPADDADETPQVTS